MIEPIRKSLSFAGRAFGYLSVEVLGMHAAAYVLALSSLASSLLALLRDRLLAHTFGAGIELDLYYAAFRIPDILFVAIGALVSAYVLIPVLASRDEDGQRRYIDSVVFGFSLLAISASIIAFIAAPSLLNFLFPKLADGATFPTLILLTRILLLQPILLGLSNILAAVTQSRHRYLLYALAPIVYNLGIVAGILVLYPRMGLIGLGWGVCLGAALHFGIQLPSAMKDGFLSFKNRLEIGTIFETFRISIPRALALSMSQVAFLGLLMIAGTLVSGSISIFMFGFNLQAVPLAIIGASYSVAAFPTLSRLSKNGSDDFVMYVATATRHIFFWSMPALMLLVVLRAHVVRAVLGTGEFDWTDTRLTAAALALFAVSLAANGVTLLLIRAYYASGKTAIPLVVSAFSAMSAIALALLTLLLFKNPAAMLFIESLLRVDYVPGGEVLALPLGYSIASVLGAFLLVYLFNRTSPGYVRMIGRAFGESLTAAFVGSLVAYGALVMLGTVTFASTLASVLTRGGIAGIVGILAAAFVYNALGSREYGETLQALTRRIWRDVEPVSSAESADVTLS